MKLEVLKILFDNKDNYISGEKIASKLNITRNTIWKDIKSLKKDGYTIDSKKSCGYCFTTNNEMMTDFLFKEYVKNDFISNSFILNTCDSTNTYLKNISMKNSTAEGTIVVANSQSNGKGRQGRLFYSPENVGLYFSILLKPFKIDLITSFIATSVATAIDKLYNVNTQIKWVNDIYLNGKKICGILTEGQIEIESQSPSFLIIGIGINVNNISINKELSNIATSLFIETKKSINRLELLSEIINNISNYANKISKGDFISIYRKKMFLVNSKIKFTRNNKILIGKVLGVDDDCSLIIETDNNEIINLNSGEVHIISV